MKTKKYMIPFLGILLSLSACGKPIVKRTGIKDGTYLAKAQGYRGDVEVEVLFEKTRLKSIKIVNQQETEALSKEALTVMPKAMIEKQSVNVDVSTGATVTSKAIQDAVRNAIEQAGGTVSEWEQDRTSKSTPKIEKVETKVVVVGAGPSGIATTLRLRQLGIPTVLVDKAREVGGSMAFSSNAYQYVSGTNLDVQSKTLPATTLAANLQKLGNGNLEMIQNFQNQLQDTLNWQSQDLGMTFEKTAKIDPSDGTLTAVSYEKKKDELLALFRREVGVSGADLYMESSFNGYLKEGDKIVGVRIKKADGKQVEIKANYVVLAMGSQLKNNEGLTPVDTIRVFAGPSEDQGDGFLLAKLEGYETVESMPSIFQPAGANDGKAAVSVLEIVKKMKASDYVVSDAKGNLMAANTFETGNFEAWIKSLDHQTAYLWLTQSAYKNLLKEVVKGQSLKEDFVKKMVEKDSLVLASGDSVSAIAKKANITLPNGIQLSGQLYCLKLEPYRIQSLAGLKTNAQYQVIQEGKPVSNVFAVGSMVSGVFGNNSTLGLSNAFSFVSGKFVAQEIKTLLEANQ